VRVSRIALPVYWLALFTATHYPRVPDPAQIPNGDKVLHFGAFAVLASLWWAFVRPVGGRGVWLAAAVLIPYAALDEWLQQFTGRFTDPMDFVANAAGVAVALAVLEVRRRVSGARSGSRPSIDPRSP
jgi:VanZ family protein